MVAQTDVSEAPPPTGGSGSRPLPVGLLTIGVVLLVLVLVVLLVVLKLTDTSSPPHAPTTVQQASAALVKQVTTLDAKNFNAVGDPSAPLLTPPVVLKDPATLTSGGLPAVVWVGTLFSPQSAAERWPLVIALGRFGTFGKLYTTASAASEVFKNTVTFSFQGSEYHSSEIALSAVEEYGNQPSTTAPAGYEQLAHPDALQTAALDAYDHAPWIDSVDPGGLPFLDIANRIIVSSSSFSPGVLSGLTMQQVVTALSTQPQSQVSQALLGAANQITAGICAATGERPAKVCSTPGVAMTSARLGLGS
jgi:hypothetical protein